MLMSVMLQALGDVLASIIFNLHRNAVSYRKQYEAHRRQVTCQCRALGKLGTPPCFFRLAALEKPPSLSCPWKT